MILITTTALRQPHIEGAKLYLNSEEYNEHHAFTGLYSG